MSEWRILIAGEAAQGKSTSLMNLCKDNPKKVAYLSAEAGKDTPFRNNFTKMQSALENPEDALAFFRAVEQDPNIEYCVLDGFNFLMQLFVTKRVRTAKDTRAAWGDYAHFVNVLMHQIVATSTKKWIIIAHNARDKNPDESLAFRVPLQGSAGKIGFEAFFNFIVYAKKVPLVRVKEWVNENSAPYLHITPKDERLGYKHVFQVASTGDTADSCIRSFFGMWEDDVIYTDNDVSLIADAFTKFLSE